MIPSIPIRPNSSSTYPSFPRTSTLQTTHHTSSTPHASAHNTSHTHIPHSTLHPRSDCTQPCSKGPCIPKTHNTHRHDHTLSHPLWSSQSHSSTPPVLIQHGLHCMWYANFCHGFIFSCSRWSSRWRYARGNFCLASASPASSLCESR
jgi:hypothetical protein